MGVGRTSSGKVDWPLVLNYLVGDNTWKSAGIHSEPAPDWNRFTKIVLDDQDIDEPMELAVLPDGRVIFIERKGRMKIYEPEAGKSRLLAEFDVCTEGNYEDGLLGITIDPSFEHNGYIYVYYAPPCEIKEQYLSQVLSERGFPDYGFREGIAQSGGAERNLLSYRRFAYLWS